MPEVFLLQSSENRSNRQASPMDNDRYTPLPTETNPSFRSSSPPLKSTSNQPEFYHLNASHDKPARPLPPPSPPPMAMSPGPTNDNDYRSSPTLPVNNRVSPLPRSNLKKPGVEMYHLAAKDDVQQSLGPPKTTRFNDQPTRYDDDNHDPSHQPGKVTVFTISAANEGNNPPASPPVSSIELDDSDKIFL